MNKIIKFKNIVKNFINQNKKLKVLNEINYLLKEVSYDK